MLPENFLRLKSFWVKVFGLGIFVYFIYNTIDFWLALILSVSLSFVMYPLVQEVKKITIGPGKYHLPEVVSILISFVVATAFLVFSFVFIVLPLLDEINNLAINLPDIALGIKSTTMHLQRSLPADTQHVLTDYITQAEQFLSALIKNAMQDIIAFASRTVQLVIVPVLSFYFLKDWRNIREGFIGILPHGYKEPVEHYFNEVADMMSAYVRGMAKLSCTAATVITLGAYSMELDYPLVLGLMAAFGEIIPVVGPIVAALPAVILSAVHAPDMLVKVILFYLFFNQIDSNIIIPKIMGDAISLHPIAILFSLMVGAKLFGVPGMIFAVPTAAFFKLSCQHLFYIDKVR